MVIVWSRYVLCCYFKPIAILGKRKINIGIYGLQQDYKTKRLKRDVTFFKTGQKHHLKINYFAVLNKMEEHVLCE